VRQHAHHTERDIVLQTLFIAGGRGVNLVFRAPPPSQNSNWNLFSGSANARGWENFAIFHRNRSLSRKRYDTGRWLL